MPDKNTLPPWRAAVERQSAEDERRRYANMSPEERFSELRPLLQLAWAFFEQSPARARAEALGDARSAESLALWKSLMQRRKASRDE